MSEERKLIRPEESNRTLTLKRDRNAPLKEQPKPRPPQPWGGPTYGTYRTAEERKAKQKEEFNDH